MKGLFHKTRTGTIYRMCMLSGAVAIACTAHAQAPDPAELRSEALTALGQDLSGLALSGSGWDACLGQAWSVAEGWARWELTEYQRLFDYENGTSSHTALRRAGMDPGRIGGCGAQPDANPAPQQGFIGADSAWTDQLLIWLTPHGFLNLLETNTATVTEANGGWQVTVPLERGGIDYTVIGTYNDDFELEQITTWVDDAIFGDMEIRMAFGDYRDFGQLRYPESLTLEQGGFATLHLDVDNVSLYTEAVQNTVARRGGGAAQAAADPAYEEIGPGIFAFHGNYQGVAVEFDDYIVVLDGLQSDARVKDLIEQIKAAIPGKPIRYVLSTHSHFDHAYGLRQFAAEGATIVTHDMNVEFFREALSTPRTLRAAGSATEPDEVPVMIQGVSDRWSIEDDAGQVVEVHALGESPHAADMLIAYLPSINAVVEADVLQPWINPVFGGANGPHPFLIYLDEGLKRLDLDYERFVPIHVPPSPPLMQREDLEAVLTGQQ